MMRKKKRCCMCGQEKHVSEFSKCSGHSDGLASNCKACASAYRKRWSAKNTEYLRHVKKIDYLLHQEHYNELSRRRRQENPDCRKGEARRRTERRGEEIRRYSAKYRKLHKKAYAAADKVQKAVKTGRLTKPSVCSLCGSPRNLRAHHSDYDKPLDVLWVCESCHRMLHNKEAQNEAVV